MKTKSYKNAKADGDIRYYTGKECKRGHRADRYTSNGGCVLCVGNAPTEGGVATTKGLSAEVKERLPEHRLRAYLADVPSLQRVAIAICAEQFPGLPVALFRSGKMPTGQASGTALFTFRYPPEYAQTMLTLSNMYLQARSTFDPAQVRAGVVHQAQELAAENRPPPAEWSYT